MPKSQPKGKSKPVLKQVLEKANAIDRRRRAQIDNQKQAINRLLEAMNDGTPVKTAVTREMEVLHQGAAELRAQRDEATEALAQLVKDARKLAPAWIGPIEQSLSDAETLLGSDAG